MSIAQVVRFELHGVARTQARCSSTSMVSVATATVDAQVQCAYRVGSVANDTAGAASSVVATFSAVSSANATYLRKRPIRHPFNGRRSRGVTQVVLVPSPAPPW